MMTKMILAVLPACLFLALDASTAELGGFAGRKAATLLEGRVFSRYAQEDAMDECVKAFETHYDDTHKPGSGLWQGEYWGRTMLGHTGAFRMTGREDLRDYILRQADRLIVGHMKPDGYLGTYANPRFVKRGWNLWGRKYTIWGLIEAYETTGERRFLDAAEKTTAQLLAMLADMNLTLRETGSFNGVASCSILCPLVSLYRHSPKTIYKNAMKAIVSDWDRADGAPPNLVANAFSGKPLHEWYPNPVVWAKTAEILNCYEGLVAYSELTGDARILEAAVRTADLIAAHETNPMGAVGYFDHMTHAAANPNGTIEMCDVMYWIRLCHALYRATGETRHLDRAERAFCNAYLAGLYDCGRWGAYSVRAHGYRHGAAAMAIGMRHHTCCIDNSPRGVFSFVENIAFLRDGILEINHYLPAKVALEGGVEVRIAGDYPIAEDAQVEVVAPHPMKIGFRVPDWCAEVEIDGKPVRGERGRVVVHAPSGRATFALRFPMSARIVHRPDLGGPALLAGHECDGKGNDGALFLFEQPKLYPEMEGVGRNDMAAYIMRGPLVLAKTSRLGLPEKDVFASGTINGDKTWKATVKPLPTANGFWGVWELTLSNGTEWRTMKVGNFASVAPNSDWHNAFSIWF